MGAWIRLDLRRFLEMGRQPDCGGEFRREFAKHRMVRTLLDETERGRIPKGGGSTVAE